MLSRWWQLLRIWIDFTNSPHVLVFRPLLEIFRRSGHEVSVTARDFAQTLGLCERFGIEYTALGHHRGGELAKKGVGLLARSIDLWRWARKQKFDLALAHGSNDISVAARLLGVPSVTMFDYEFARLQHNINCRLAQAVVVPDAIPAERLTCYGASGKCRFYPGLKEEYYLADFEPDSAVLDQLGLDRSRRLVVIRTPPEVALYHRFSNDLQPDLFAMLKAHGDVQVVVLARADEQRQQLIGFNAGNFIVPSQAIDAQSLIAHADLLIGAGGTMNREAVALGTPVYSTFQGRLGAVDEALVEAGRLKLLTDINQLRLERRQSATNERVRRDPQLLARLLLTGS